MEPDDLATVRRLGQLTEAVHAVVYFAAEARDAYADLGLRGYWRGYFASRCAPAGPIGPELATALLGGFAPSMVARALPEVWSITSPTAVIAARTKAATTALTRLFEGIEPATATRVADLTARCVDEIDLAGRPMAAAQRSTPRPTDPIGALWYDVTVLREHRGDGHLASITASGLRWPEPHLLIRDRLDPAQREHRGWTEDEWSTAAQRVGDVEAADIDRTTDLSAAPAYAGLSSADRLALAAGLAPLAGAAAAELPFPNAMGLVRPDT